MNCYVEGSLKAKTRAKRTTSAISYEVHDEMSSSIIPLKDLSSSRTKKGLCKLLAQALLKHFEGTSKHVFVTYNTVVNINSPHII